MNNDQENLIYMVRNLLEKWKLCDAQKCEILGVSGLSDLHLLLGEKSSSGDSAVFFRVQKLLQIHGLLRSLFPSNFELVYGWMTQKNEFFDQHSPAEFIVKNSANDTGMDQVIDYLKSQCFNQLG